MAYRPSQAPPFDAGSDASQLAQWAQDELDAIRADQSESVALDLRPIFVTPTRPREGLIIYADGTQFDPGFGKGPYVWDGSLWLPLSGRPLMRAARNYFVRTDGSDSNTGLVNTAGGAFLTIQKAVNVALTLDLNSFALTINVATGTYGNVTVPSPFVGGLVTILGNTTTPSNVVMGSLTCTNGAQIGVSGMRALALVVNGGGAQVRLSGRMQFNPTNRPALYAFVGDIINDSRSRLDFVSNNVSVMILSDGKSVIDLRSCVMTGAVDSAVWFLGIRMGLVWLQGSLPIPGATGSVGAVAAVNGAVSTGGTMNLLPGTTKVSTSTGGVVE